MKLKRLGFYSFTIVPLATFLIVTFAISLFASPTAQAEKPLPFYDASDLSPYWPDESPQSRKPARLESLNVLDQLGHRVTEKAFDGKISFVNYFFASCGSICPAQMRTIQRVQGHVRAVDVHSVAQFFSFSTTPDQDTPERLRVYAKTRHMRLANWSLLTGDAHEIFRIGREIFRADRSVGPQKSEGSFLHSSNVYLVDTQRRVRGIYDTASRESMRFLEQDAIRLIQHASH